MKMVKKTSFKRLIWDLRMLSIEITLIKKKEENLLKSTIWFTIGIQVGRCYENALPLIVQ